MKCYCKTSWQMGEHLLRDDWENHSKNIFNSDQSKDQSRLLHFGKKVLPGIFLGYAMSEGGIWKGDKIVLPIADGTGKLCGRCHEV